MVGMEREGDDGARNRWNPLLLESINTDFMNTGKEEAKIKKLVVDVCSPRVFPYF